MKSIRLVLLLLGGSWGFSLATQASPGPQVDPQMPQFEFVENKRQWADDVRYRADIPNGFLLLKPNSLFYVFYDREKLNRLKHGQLGSQQAFFRVQEDPNRLRAHGVEVAFLGANPAPVTQASGQTEAVRNYFTGQDASRWASDVHGYTEVNYEQLYPGIHLRLFSKDAALKYEYEVAPGSNPALIRAQYRGAAGLRLQNGDLVVETTLTDFSEYRPYSYQRINGRQVEVPSRFRLDGDVLSYEFPQGYDPRYPLVIDPRLIFSTYSGSVADNWGNTATFDAEGNLYSGGTAFATNFPVTAGAFDVSFGNADYQNLTDVVVMKFSPDGRRLLYATFLGGGDSETPHSMIVNNAGDLVVYGSTSSRNFPVSQGAFQTAFGGGTSRIYNPGAGLPGAIGGVSYFNGSDIFVSTLSATGNRLVASTYVGGNGNDGIAHTGDNVVRNYGDELRGEVIVDAQNNVYIASCTRSTNFPVRNASQSTNRGQLDGVVFRLNASLSNMDWGTYIGGSNADDAFALTLRQNELYVVGGTSSSNLSVPANALRPNYQEGIDGFIFRYAANAGNQVGGSYLGTSGFDQAYFVDTDETGDVYVFGTTNGNYPVSPGVYNNPRSGQFVQKLNPALTTSLFSTVVGAGRGVPDISPTAFLVNDCGNIYLAGWGGETGDSGSYGTASLNQRTRVTGMPTTPDAIRTTTVDGDDFYLMLLSPNAQSLVYGTFIGGPRAFAGSGDHVDGGTSRFDRRGVIYHTVCACRSNSFPSTPGVWATSNRSGIIPGSGDNGCNLAGFRIDIDDLQAAFLITDPNGNPLTRVCAPADVRFPNRSVNGITYEWDIRLQGSNTPLRSSTSTDESFRFTQTGTYVITLTARNNTICRSDVTRQTLTVGTGQLRVSQPSTICPGESVQLQASGGGANYEWSPATGLSDPRIANPVARPTQSITYRVRSVNAEGCALEDTVRINVTNIEADFTTAFADACDSIPRVQLTNRSSANATTFVWDFGNGTSFNGRNPPAVRYAQPGRYLITLRATGANCTATDTVSVNIRFRASTVRLSAPPSICTGQSTQLQASGGTSYLWSPATGLSNPNIANPVARPTVTTRYNVRISDPASNCTRDTFLIVTVGEAGVADFTAIVPDPCAVNPVVELRNLGQSTATYRWDFGDGRTSTEFQPGPLRYARPGVYRIILTAGTGSCVARDTAVVDVRTNAGLNITRDTSICLGESVQLQVGGGGTYLWSPATGLSNVNIANPVANPTQTTRYTVRVTNGTCVRDTAVLVTVVPRITAAFRVELLNDCDPFPSVRIINESQNGTVFDWDLGDGRTFRGQQPPPFKYTREGEFQIRLLAQTGRCSAQQTNPVSIRSSGLDELRRNAQVSPNVVICAGTTTANLLASGGVRYQWSPAAGLSNPNIANPVANPGQTTRYTVRIFNVAGCFVELNVDVDVVPQITPNFDVETNAECGQRAQVRVTNRTTGAQQFRWLLGNGTVLEGPNPPAFTYERSGTYEVTLEAISGQCVQRRSVRIEVENVLPPNVITPNGDGFNDRFVVNNVRPGWQLQVFDRWGVRVFASDNYQNDWGGEANNATYYYLLTSPEGRSCKGWVQVLRGNN